MFRLLSILTIVVMSHAVQAQTPNVVTLESTVTGTVDRIERTLRVVTLRLPGNVLQAVSVDPSLKVFDDLKRGDVVTVRFVESVVVQVRPGAALSNVEDSTAEARQAGQEQVVRQVKAVVTVEAIDAQGTSITYRTKDGLKTSRHVSDKRILEGVRAGDRVEVTLTQERAVSIEPVRR